MKKKNIGLIAGIVLLVVLCVVYFVLHNHNANSSEADSTDTATTAFGDRYRQIDRADCDNGRSVLYFYKIR